MASKIWLAAVVASISSGAPAPSMSAPLLAKHAVTILVDDLGYSDTGHRGAEFPTKNIDELALAGIRL